MTAGEDACQASGRESQCLPDAISSSAPSTVRSLSLRHVDRVIGNARMRVRSGAREQRTEGADGRRRAEQVSTLRTSERKYM